MPPEHSTHCQGHVSIGPPALERLRSIPVAEDVRDSFPSWLEASTRRGDILYFTIYLDDKPIGQILLHDIDHQAGESLVAYHIFDPAQRGRGYGTQALRQLQRYVVEQSDLKKLIIITSQENLASQRVAQKCGFDFSGAPREDPIHGMIFVWEK